jgi:hypothetical protein
VYQMATDFNRSGYQNLRYAGQDLILLTYCNYRKRVIKFDTLRQDRVKKFKKGKYEKNNV